MAQQVLDPRSKLGFWLPPGSVNGEGETQRDLSCPFSAPHVSPTNQSNGALILTISLHAVGEALFPVPEDRHRKRGAVW